MLKQYVYSMGAVCLGVYCFAWFQGVRLESVEDINLLFLLGLIALMAGAGIWVLKTGFFELFFQGFKTLKCMAIKNPALMKQLDGLVQSDVAFRDWKRSFTTKIATYSLGAGTGLIVLSAVLSFNR
ncbi:DUF3899 domain-containing protein [Planococcus sp. YIM B11945]|uniref:DUF3899 domain-containing protein n=1 Tax=Planococcus sp. YIM B11945 TaxID=3435410 RepID=UPI003D7E0F1D